MSHSPDEETTATSTGFGAEASASAQCASCGRQAPLATNPVTGVGAIQVCCGGCGAILLQVAISPHATWVDLRGISRVRPTGRSGIEASDS